MYHSVAGRRAAVAGGMLGVVLALTPAIPAFAYDPAAGRTVLGAGQHVDAVYPEVKDGKLEVKTLTPTGVTAPESVALHIPETSTSHTKLPAGYEFLGPEGTEAWVTTEVQDQSVVWPGWSYEGIPSGVLKGTVKTTYDRFSYAGSSTSPRFAVTQPGGFGGTKVSQLFVPGTTFTSVSGETGSHTHATWTFTAPGTYDIAFTVSATLASGTEIKDDATVRFIVGDLGQTPAEPKPVTDPAPTDAIDKLTVVPSKVDAEYFVGQTINLTAISPKSAETDTYRWYTTAPGGDKPVADPEETTSAWSTKPDRAVDGTSVYVERLSGGKVAETSAPIELHTRGLAPTTALSVTADKQTYAVGDTATFTSKQRPQTEDEHYHWYLKKADEDAYEWIPESRAADQKLPITADLNGAEVTARLFNADHAVLSESPAIRLTVGASAATLTIADTSFTVGEKATLTAEGADAVEWSVRKYGENPFTVVDAQPVVDASWNGAEVRAVARDAAGKVTAEASIPAISVAGADAAGNADDGSSSNGWIWVVVAAVVIVALIVAAVVISRRRKKSATSAS